MTTDATIKELMDERDHMVRQIASREKEIARFSQRLKQSLMPNQIAMLQAQRTYQLNMLDADHDKLIVLEKTLAAEIAKRS